MIDTNVTRSSYKQILIYLLLYIYCIFSFRYLISAALFRTNIAHYLYIEALNLIIDIMIFNWSKNGSSPSNRNSS